MSLSTVAKSTPQIQQSRIVYEYSLIVANSQDDDIQELTAAFTFIPSLQDWQQWLNGWNSCGYCLSGLPSLIRTIN